MPQQTLEAPRAGASPPQGGEAPPRVVTSFEEFAHAVPEAERDTARAAWNAATILAIAAVNEEAHMHPIGLRTLFRRVVRRITQAIITSP
ncbi:MAG: hypothetical protein IAE97_00220 [Chthoniobacterales bacterium]|nr:hypothetical protein [Chthoniobacterales bacterium]